MVPQPSPHPIAPHGVQTDPEQAAMSGLRREVKLLRAENAYLREQLFQASLPRERAPGTAGQAVLPASLPASRLPSSHGQPPAGGHSAAAAALAVTAGSRPASGGAVAGGSVGGGPSSEELMRRLLDTQRMLVQFSRENDRLAGENGRLRSRKTAVANDYKGGPERASVSCCGPGWMPASRPGPPGRTCLPAFWVSAGQAHGRPQARAHNLQQRRAIPRCTKWLPCCQSLLLSAPGFVSPRFPGSLACAPPTSCPAMQARWTRWTGCARS